MQKEQKRKLKRAKKKKHLAMLKQHESRVNQALDEFNAANYRIHLHSNPDQHAQMKEEFTGNTSGIAKNGLRAITGRRPNYA